MNQRIIFITGVNKGLGKALFDRIVKNKQNHIVAVSRRLTEYQQKLVNKGIITFIEQDLLDFKNPEETFKFTATLKDVEDIVFINNAGVIGPINKIGSFSNEDILNSLHINTFVPMAISNFLLKEFTSKKISLINISSGAASIPIVGWGLYSSTKAANKMFFDILDAQEKHNENIFTLSIDPGAIDSDMQLVIRSTEKEVFPKRDEFVKLKSNDKLLPPDIAAENIINQIKATFNLLL